MSGRHLAAIAATIFAITVNAASQAVVPTPDLNEALRLQTEAEQHIEKRQFTDAVTKTEQALALRRKHLGEIHPDVAHSIARLGVLAYYQGGYDRAELLMTQALEIREKTLGADHLLIAESLSDLASVLLVKGDYVKPEALFQRALGIYERTSATAPSSDAQALLADVLNNLALVYHKRGAYDRAESEYLRALAVRERLLGADDPSVAQVAANLGGVYYASGQYEKAVEMLSRALSIQERNLPPTHAALATSSFNLAAVYFDRGDYAKAETLFQRALTIDEALLDPRHPRLAIRLFGLAEVLRLKGDFERAGTLYERALNIRQQALGDAHPDVAATFIARGLLHFTTGDVSAAADLLLRGAQVRDETLSLVLTTGSEESKRSFLRTLIDETDIAISLNLGSAPSLPTAVSLAMTNIFQRKGRSIDATADQSGSLRGRLNDEDREVFSRLRGVQNDLSTMVLRGISNDEQRATAVRLRTEIQRLEGAISTRSTEFRIASRKPNLKDIQAALPSNAALIEFVVYRPFAVRNPRPTAFGPARYAAYVLRTDRIMGGFDLGEAGTIDAIVQRLRKELATPGETDRADGAKAMYQALLHPLTTSLAGVDHLIVSADAALNLIPFATLVDQEGKYLVEKYTISYLTSGRDLLRLSSADTGVGAGRAPVIVANPHFGPLATRHQVANSPPPAVRQTDTRLLEHSVNFAPLPGTAAEASELSKVLPEAQVHTAENATEAVVKGIRSPMILHIATHGFFLQPKQASAAGFGSPGGVFTTQSSDGRDDALFLSGLALAGVNERWSGAGEDGILTALEAAGLDLWGTRMVVLSACETGLGDARAGEGVYGLRRALVLAGSESQVITLWPVSDTATRDLMIAFYRRLRARDSRADALRQVQLEMLRRGGQQAHPYYWGSFIQSGDWRPIFH